MKLNNYTNFINESNEDSPYKKALSAFFESKGVVVDNEGKEFNSGQLKVEIYYYGINTPIFIRFGFDKSNTHLTSEEFFKNYNKNYPIYHELIKIFKEISYETKNVSNRDDSGITLRIRRNDFKNTKNNELRSYLGLSKFDL